MIGCLPKLFNSIHFFFQSISRSVITKEELIHKMISSQHDITDRSKPFSGQMRKKFLYFTIASLTHLTF